MMRIQVIGKGINLLESLRLGHALLRSALGDTCDDRNIKAQCRIMSFQLLITLGTIRCGTAIGNLSDPFFNSVEYLCLWQARVSRSYAPYRLPYDLLPRVAQ